MGISQSRILEFFDAYASDLSRPKILDIGCSNIHTIDRSALIDFIVRRHDIHDPAGLARWADYVHAGGVIDPELGGLDGAWLGDVVSRAGMDYTAFDIFTGYKTQVVDLNTCTLGPDHAGQYDVVLNFGTTEHVFNQFNAFRVMHDAAKVGALFFHELPVTLLDHGFFNYNPISLVTLAEANDYEILELKISGFLDTGSIESQLATRYRDRPYFIDINDTDGWSTAAIANVGLSMIARKRRDAPFQVGLETTTTGGAVAAEIVAEYGRAETKHDRESELRDYPLLKHQGRPVEVRFDGVEAAIAEDDLDAIIGAFHAYGEKRLLETFPVRLEAAALYGLVQAGQRDRDMRLRLGKVMGRATQAMNVPPRAAMDAIA